ncbi:MAG TPA: M20/M25/M40 family metallo-hydrolase, partial [Ardenticatenaceae bacterium]
LKQCKAIPSAGHPVVYGEWLEAGEDKPTVLIYAHYDVQPVDPIELWETPPFEPDVRDGKLYARGVVDDKAGVWVNLKALESILAATGTLPVNVKIFFEGEEETGSPSMGPFISQYKELLAADLLVISDGGSYPDRPLVMSSVRGGVVGEVTITGAKKDLHSGLFGGVAHNPAHLAAKIIAAFHDDEGRIQIPGFYDDVRRLSPAAFEEMNAQEPMLRAELEADSGIERFWGIPEYTFMERATAQPTLDVNGMYSGYQGEGVKTIIPAKAGFKVTMRLVADQDPEDIARKFAAFVRGFATETLTLDVRVGPTFWPAQLLADGPVIEAIHHAFEETWGKRATMYRVGGSVPVIGMFQQELGVPVTNLGLAVGYDYHAPNEYTILDYFYRNIETAIHVYHYLADAIETS